MTLVVLPATSWDGCSAVMSGAMLGRICSGKVSNPAAFWARNWYGPDGVEADTVICKIAERAPGLVSCKLTPWAGCPSLLSTEYPFAVGGRFRPSTMTWVVCPAKIWLGATAVMSGGMTIPVISSGAVSDPDEVITRSPYWPGVTEAAMVMRRRTAELVWFPPSISIPYPLICWPALFTTR